MSILIRLLPGKGLCLSCVENTDCPMKEILINHRQNLKDYGSNLEMLRPDLWDEYSIDEPEFKSPDIITWCPLYYTGD